MRHFAVSLLTEYMQVVAACVLLVDTSLLCSENHSIVKDESRIEDIYALSYWEGNSRSMGCVHPKAARDDFG